METVFGLAFWPPRSGGAIAQLGERVLCKHEVVGSIPSGSTRLVDRPAALLAGFVHKQSFALTRIVVRAGYLTS